MLKQYVFAPSTDQPSGQKGSWILNDRGVEGFEPPTRVPTSGQRHDDLAEYMFTGLSS
jgi:hypothetical protein